MPRGAPTLSVIGPALRRDVRVPRNLTSGDLLDGRQLAIPVRVRT